MYQLYICFDAFTPLPEQYNDIHVSFYFWLINEDHKSYFNVSTVQAWDTKDTNKLWLSTSITSFLPFELNHKGALYSHSVLPTVANYYAVINTKSVHKSCICSAESCSTLEHQLPRVVDLTQGNNKVHVDLQQIHCIALWLLTHEVCTVPSGIFNT